MVNSAPFGPLIAEPVRPQAARPAPPPGWAVADLGVGGGDHLIGVQRVSGVPPTQPWILTRRRLVGICIELANPRTNRLIIW